MLANIHSNILKLNIMDSRISIKGDFVENTPYIDVVYNPSEDSRDEMVKAFAEKLEHTSGWAHLMWQWEVSAKSANSFNFRIYPIPPHKLEHHINQMQETLRVWKEHCNQSIPTETIK